MQEAKVSSISFNQGARSLERTLAGNFGKLEKAIKNEGYIRELIKEKMKEHKD